ncbi:hypothetical protein GF319_05525 [Candidatus Bathyarchaeota archaeon]|jgi:hypothetical protein|nr:hypothetical protein [Candidatus Bathyarchaeota archaeon]
MVLPVKVFEIRGLEGDPRERLTGFQEAEPVEGEEMELLTRILDLEQQEDMIHGVFAKDFLREITYRRQVITNATTEEAPFWTVKEDERDFLIVMAPSTARGVKKLLSNNIAVKIGEILNVDVRESRITSETLQKLHESNPQSTNLIWFDNMDLPGVNKLCLSGEGLADTGQYRDYIDHGMIWYVVFTSQKSGYTVGVTRNSVVTNFSKSTEEEFVEFVREEILPLIE